MPNQRQPTEIQLEAMAEVEAAEAAVLPRFVCGVYTKRVVIDSPINVVVGWTNDRPEPTQPIKFHYEDIQPVPWWRFDPPIAVADG